MLDQRARLSELGAFTQGMPARVVKQHELIVLRADGVLREVCREQWQLLATALVFCEAIEIVAFGSKAHAKRWLRTAGNGCQDIDRGLELQAQCLILFL